MKPEEQDSFLRPSGEVGTESASLVRGCSQQAVRVREGGEVLQTIDLDLGCFACALGGADKRTLFLVVTDEQHHTGVRGGCEILSAAKDDRAALPA